MNLVTIDVDGLFPQQREAMTAMTNWFKSDKLEFTLSGYAGTGKTHVISTFLKTTGKSINHCVTAPTHKALGVIERQIGSRGKTLHSLHGLRMNVDLSNFDIEKPQFDPQGFPHIQNFRLVIIDEASMINRDLFTLNHLAAEKYRTKIIYVGDPLQLPPVNEEIGHAFTSVPDNYNLTEIVRQSDDNDLLTLFTMLRDDIRDQTSNCITHLIMSRNKNVAKNYKVLSSNLYSDEILKYYTSPLFESNIDHIRQGAYSRRAVSKWNEFVRGHTIGSSKLLTIDDMLTAYSNQIDSFKMPIVKNSNDYILSDIDDYTDNIGIKTYAVNLKGVQDLKTTPKLLILDHNDEISRKKVTDALNYLHYKADVLKHPGGFKNYYNFRNNMMLMTDITLSEKNGSKKVGKDFDYGYALTIHKLQGSTIDNIAIDLKDIINPAGGKRISEVDIRNRLLYVGLSRATNNAIIHY